MILLTSKKYESYLKQKESLQMSHLQKKFEDKYTTDKNYDKRSIVIIPVNTEVPHIVYVI